MKIYFLTAAMLLSVAGATAQTEESWWKEFGDATLDSLVTRGLEANYELGAAVNRIGVARAAVGQAKAAYWPTVGVSAGWGRTGISGVAERGAGTDATWTSAFTGEATLSWEPDVFGKITAQVKARKADVRVTRAEFEGVRLSIASAIAQAYISLRMSQSLYAVAREHEASQSRVLDMVLARFEAGLASKLDVAQARTVYFSTRARVPLLMSEIDTYVNALGVLLACGPEGLPAEVTAPGTMPGYDRLVPAEVPLDLVRRRPDVAQAQATIESAAAALGVAKKDYLPSLTVQGSIGTQAHRAGDLFTGRSLIYSVTPTLSWTVFDGLGRRYATEGARQAMEADIALYNQTVLTAVQESANAISNYHQSVEYISTLAEVIEQCREALRLSVDLYKEGLTPFSNVVDAQMNLLEYQSTDVQARGRALGALVNFHKAIGGSIAQ